MLGLKGGGQTSIPSSSRLWGAETAQGRVSCCLWQHLGDCCLVQELILKSRTSNNPLQSHFPRVFCVQNSDTMTAALVSKSSPEPGTTWTSQIPAIPKPILSLQQDFYIFFFPSELVCSQWCENQKKAGILALRNSRKNTVQRPQVLPGSGMREFQMSNLLSCAAAEGALPSRRRCHRLGFGLSVPTDFSKWQKYASKPQPLAAPAAQINTLVIA